MFGGATIQTSAGPIAIEKRKDREKPVSVKLGEGFTSITVALTVDQAARILAAIAMADSAITVAAASIVQEQINAEVKATTCIHGTCTKPLDECRGKCDDRD